MDAEPTREKLDKAVVETATTPRKPEGPRGLRINEVVVLCGLPYRVRKFTNKDVLLRPMTPREFQKLAERARQPR